MSGIKRRQFLSAAAAVGAGAFAVSPFRIATSGESANNKVNIAMIGNGGIARMAYGGVKGENIVAVCDVDEGRNKRKGAKSFTDYRVMFDKMGKEIDGVCVNTPDHSHFAATMIAMQLGIHVCTQKPLTHDIWQARTLYKAALKYPKVITNMGNQGHTFDGIRKMRECYEAGLLGDVKEVHCGLSGPNWREAYFHRPKKMPLPKQKVPGNLKWDLWLGQAPKTAYNRAYHPLSWRSFWDYGTGMPGDWFCHIADGPVWVLDLYEPVSVECVERNENPPGVIPNSATVRWEFGKRNGKAPCTLYWYDGVVNGGKPIKQPDQEWEYGKPRGSSGSFWFGEKQNAYLDCRSNNLKLPTKAAMLEAKKVPEKYKRVRANGPHGEWVEAIKGGPEPGANFKYAAKLTETCLLGVLAERFGGKIEWDAKNGKVTNRPELNEFVKEPVRNGWEKYGEDLWK